MVVRTHRMLCKVQKRQAPRPYRCVSISGCLCVFLQLWSKCRTCVARLCVGNRRVCTHCTLRHVSDPQWFPLNMLIEIAYKFTEHLCSSAMSKLFGRRCFRRAFHFFFYFSLFLSLFSSNFHDTRCAQCICMC